MFFEPRKSQIVPVLPAASREAGRTVTTADVAQPSGKKSGFNTSVQPAVGLNSGMRPAVSGMRAAVGLNSGMRPAVSGMRPAVGLNSGLHPSMNPSAAQTVMLPRVEFPQKSIEGKTILLWLCGGLLVGNLVVTVLVLASLQRSSPEEIEQRVRISTLQQEVAKLKADNAKNFDHVTRVYNQLQLDTDTARTQLQTMSMNAIEQNRGKRPYEAGKSIYEPVKNTADKDD